MENENLYKRLSDVESDISSLRSEVRHIATALKGFSDDIKSLSGTISSQGKPNYVALVGLGSFLVAAITFYTNQTIDPVKADVKANREMVQESVRQVWRKEDHDRWAQVYDELMRERLKNVCGS